MHLHLIIVLADLQVLSTVADSFGLYSEFLDFKWMK